MNQLKSDSDNDVGLHLRQAIETVNHHAGQTCVRLRFADDPDEIDFIANSARLIDGAFEFQAGIETLSGSIEELSAVRVDVIH